MTAAHNAQLAPGVSLSQQALADEVYLDGTGPSARRTTYASQQPVVTRYTATAQYGGPTKPIVRTRPTALEPDARAQDLSGSTTGSRNSASHDPNKPFSDAWWERERREDARLRAKMNICNGC